MAYQNRLYAGRNRDGILRIKIELLSFFPIVAIEINT